MKKQCIRRRIKRMQEEFTDDEVTDMKKKYGRNT